MITRTTVLGLLLLLLIVGPERSTCMFRAMARSAQKYDPSTTVEYTMPLYRTAQRFPGGPLSLKYVHEGREATLGSTTVLADDEEVNMVTLVTLSLHGSDAEVKTESLNKGRMRYKGNGETALRMLHQMMMPTKQPPQIIETDFGRATSSSNSVNTKPTRP
ncbi:unnamed protein product [Gongylonema pulchrum]|uniref:SCP2 domain-containing protein n=1 Tax=Gongylonema pulchrum TaxID=637853 RepID=A0A183E6B4_9BILA|nr:unnamed protein product [Gongylonema pulchrum]